MSQQGFMNVHVLHENIVLMYMIHMMICIIHIIVGSLFSSILINLVPDKSF